MSKKRFVIYCHEIPDSPKETPKIHTLFFCRSGEIIRDIMDWLDAYSKEAGPSNPNPRRSRGVAVVRVDGNVLSSLPEGRRPETTTGDVFTSLKEAARALGVSRAYLHRMLKDASTSSNDDFAFPAAKIRGVWVAFVDDLPG